MQSRDILVVLILVRKCAGFAEMFVLAFLGALIYCVFVFPNRFAPAGIDGVCTMIQDTFNINMGYLSLICNIPLLIVAFLRLSREFAIKSCIYVIVSSVAVILIKESSFSRFFYFTPTGTSTVLAPLIAGVIRGMMYARALKLNGSAGGIDIISAIIKIKKPHLNFMDNVFIINTVIAIASFWVYGMNIEPVICSIIYAFVSNRTCCYLRDKEHENIKYEIITKSPGEVVAYINSQLHQKATVLNAKGAYSDEDTSVVMCIVQKNYAPYLESFLLEHPDCITFKSLASDSIAGVTYK